MAQEKMTFGKYLVQEGHLREADLRQALYVCGRRGNRIGDGLVEAGVLKRAQVEELHARFLSSKKRESTSESHFFLRT
jgi:hypothetical protein